MVWQKIRIKKVYELHELHFVILTQSALYLDCLFTCNNDPSPDRVHHTSGQHEVIRSLLLQHQPHPLHIVPDNWDKSWSKSFFHFRENLPGVAPVPHAVQVAELKTLELPEVDLGNRPKSGLMNNEPGIWCKQFLFMFSYLVIFLVTKVSPLLGLSWLKRIPLHAYML